MTTEETIKQMKEAKAKLQLPNTPVKLDAEAKLKETGSTLVADTSKSSGAEIKKEASIGDTKGKETIFEKKSSNTIQSPSGVTSPASPTFNLYEFFYKLVGAGGIIEIFGDTGTTKTGLCTKACEDARKLNKHFFYFDTEGKAGLENKKTLGKDYKYLPIWDEIIKTIKTGFPPADLLIIDSLGFPFSTEIADMGANEMGTALQELMAAVGKHLKSWAFKNNAIVIFTNQPKSDYMKSEEQLVRLSALGDKVHFAPTIILKSTKTTIPGRFDQVEKKMYRPKAVGAFASFRSTDFVDDEIILLLIKNDDGVTIEIPGPVQERLKKIS